MTKTHYVAGLMFDPELKHVALIEKNRPAWQAGKLNAIGGHVEAGEQPYNTMFREFFEETGFLTFGVHWKRFAQLSGPDFLVDFFATTGPIRELRSTTDEKVIVFGLEAIDDLNAIPNLTWLIPLARLSLMGKTHNLVITEVQA